MAMRRMKTSKGKTKVKPMAGPPAKPVFRKTAKKPEADDTPGMKRPAAHSPAEAGRAHRNKALMKRLGNKAI